jgi:hypothetical protein
MDHYMILNLCSERSYPSEMFSGRVARFPFDDHNPPPLPTILHFCMFVEDFLSKDPENVIAIHCKGGKGRTGLMVAAWLLYSKRQTRHAMVSEQAMLIFAERRTNIELGGGLQGVSGQSQIRYLHYFEQLCFLVSVCEGFVSVRMRVEREGEIVRRQRVDVSEWRVRCSLALLKGDTSFSSLLTLLCVYAGGASRNFEGTGNIPGERRQGHSFFSQSEPTRFQL